MRKWLVVLLFLAVAGYGLWNVMAADKPNEANGAGPEVDQTAPDLTLPALGGQSVKLSALRGKAVVLNFWTSWCPPCKKEMPELAKFYERHGREVALLAVHLTTQDTLDNAERFAKANRLVFPVGLDVRGEALRQYRIQTIPTTYIIDPNGVIRRKIVGPVTAKRLEQETALFR
ncbi:MULTISPECIES: TlpA family protein disulfide reductase [Geobacillus]|uniref:Alkyl hydroperoxide reductase n=6 Tax=Geobacillus TaxID=129337 RepID=A0A7U9J825_GEOTM|nr:MULTISPECIES: TlpA disulfide reductase family protein [Geobacillus]AEV19107.1 Thiol:disulfide interchange protein TlpA [Geobacillus thermoleovorans CCB_US3_UF5]AMV10798.1 alkyl hydroperoxide reductase [Geobacillus thermoleovorans]AOL34416.1 alkyl hydroperoxide reductase [Geobacillus thermoleovorans]AUI35509.1 TlpA family protein disulfide reductase [[Bacillus] caldolyticus]AWO76201.1 TlpA family protein disulfide reductase [Geobacillus thermoleovorans]